MESRSDRLKLGIRTKMIQNLNSADEHFHSYLHFTNFGSQEHYQWAKRRQSPYALCHRAQSFVEYFTNLEQIADEITQTKHMGLSY